MPGSSVANGAASESISSGAASESTSNAAPPVSTGSSSIVNAGRSGSSRGEPPRMSADAAVEYPSGTTTVNTRRQSEQIAAIPPSGTLPGSTGNPVEQEGQWIVKNRAAGINVLSHLRGGFRCLDLPPVHDVYRSQERLRVSLHLSAKLAGLRRVRELLELICDHAD